MSTPESDSRQRKEEQTRTAQLKPHGRCGVRLVKTTVPPQCLRGQWARVDPNSTSRSILLLSYSGSKLALCA